MSRARTWRAVKALVLAFLLAASWSQATLAATWEFDHVGLKGVLYPSLMLGLSHKKIDFQNKPTELGDRNGLFGVTVVSPRAGAKAVVEIVSSSPLVNTGRAEVTLPKKGEKYLIYPYLTCTNGVVLVRQAHPAVFTAKLTLDGQPQGERQAKVTIASINDCVHSFSDDDDFVDTDWLYSAYVNENHSAVQNILREALASGEVSSFSGYQTDAAGVRRQVKAIWQTLRRRGIRYSSISHPSVKPKDVGVQHVRLISDALASRQANCVEGSCLLASVFYKIGLETCLVSLSDHMLVGVVIDPKSKLRVVLETTMLGDSTFEEAAESGEEQVEEATQKARKAAARKKASGKKDDDDEDDEAPQFISIREMRKAGIEPIPEPEAQRKNFMMLK